MKMIKMLSDAMWMNIDEACDKIKEAYRLRDVDRQIADWYKEMADAHIKFNSTAHANVKRLIDQANVEMQDNPMIPGMMAVYTDLHADIMAKSAEVQAMIAAYK